MAIGLRVTRDSLDQRIGTLALQLRSLVDQERALKEYMDAKTADDLVQEFGYTLDEANVVKSMVADLDELRMIYEGVANLPATKDFRTFVRRAWGLG